MSKLFLLFRKIMHFINHKMWHYRIDKLDKKQSFFIKQARIFTLSIKGFNEDKCLLKASALTYYSMFSIVPVLALIFAIAKGFGFEKKLQANLLSDFGAQKDTLTTLFDYANKTLENTKGGLIAGVGVVLLLWTVMKLLGSIEDSFNEIWEIKKGRTFLRKFTDYLSIMLIAPIFLMLSASITVIIKTQVGNAVSSWDWLSYIGPAVSFMLKGLSVILMWTLFTFIYMALPNTKVKFKSAMIAGLVAAILFELVEWAYLTFQIGAVRYGEIYGSFAALPLFLIWMQTSWFIVLFGAELAFANQNVDHYELENEIQNISVRYKRVLALLVANTVVKNFIVGKEPLTATEIAHKCDMPIRLARNIIFDFTETKIFSEVKTSNEKEFAYQPGISENLLSVKYIIDVMDQKGVNQIPIHLTHELECIQKVMDDFDAVLKENKENVLVKDIL